MVSARPYHHGSLATALLDAAQDVLESDGREQISLRELARRLGVSHAAPARHFKDREALLDALACRALVQVGQAIEDASASVGDTFRERLTAFVLAQVHYAAEHPRLMQLMTERKDNPGTPELSDLARRIFARPVADLDRARASGEVSDPLGARCEDVLQAVLLGLVQLAIEHRDAVQLDRIVEATVDSVVTGLGPGVARSTSAQQASVRKSAANRS